MRCASPFHLIVRLAALLLAAAPGLASAVTPYLQTPTANSIWVTWKTDTGNESVVEYGTDAGNLVMSTAGTFADLDPSPSANYLYHSVHLTGLSPETTYFYRVRTGSIVSDVHSFRTPPVLGTSTGHFRILVLGDHQIRNQQRYIELVRRARAKLEDKYGQSIEQSVNIVLNVGDQVDVGTLDHWENLHFAQSAPISPNLPIQTTVGNHETYYDPGLANYRAHFHYEGVSYAGISPPDGDAYYALQVANTLFIHLNSESTTSTQTNWVSQVIDAASVDPSVQWIISLSHRPYQAEQYVGDISGWLRNDVMSILSRTPKHVLNIGAHHHIYARGMTSDWATYHIISGGTAWDQFWGQSNEANFSDVDATIANWAWQIVDINLDTREMQVESYGEAHPRLGYVYDNRLIDSFHRKLDLGPPAQPTITTDLSQPVDLSAAFTLETSPFSSTYGETLHSVQFQIAGDAGFNTVRREISQPVRDIYGDTGAPAYEPVDVGFGADANRLTLPAQELANGSYHLRARHRDNNAMWSPWSLPVAFSVSGSRPGDPTVSLASGQFPTGSTIPVFYENAGGRSNPVWLAIYREGQTPGRSGVSAFKYPLPAAAGVETMGPLTKNDFYFVSMFERTGPTTNVEISPRAKFFYGDIPSLNLAHGDEVQVGTDVTVNWQGSPGNPQDWIGIYRVGDVPGTNASTQFAYVGQSTGSVNFNGLPKGYYRAIMFVNNTFTQIGNAVSFTVFDPASPIATASSPSGEYEAGTPVSFSFASGPGTPKDYVGIFRAGAIPGIDLLVSYLYVDGNPSGGVTFTEELPSGDYYAALFINDSYTEVSNRVYFSVLGTPDTVSVPLPLDVLVGLAAMLLAFGILRIGLRYRS